jgi:hypothetical protein
MKICTRCKENKPLSEYHKRSESKAGTMSACKVCRNSYNKKKAEEIGHDVSYAIRKAKNPELEKKKSRDYYLANSETLKSNTRRNARSNPQLHAKKKAEEYLRNKEKYIYRASQWAEKNPSERKAIGLKYYYSKKSCPKFIAGTVARKMVYRVLALTGKRKATKTESIIGYSRQDLVDHIESLFENGMSWNNHGDWHIDHRTSVSELVGLGVKDPAVINSLNNLQPLWAFENLSKSNSYTLAPSNIEQIKVRVLYGQDN